MGRRINFSNVVSLLALFIALGGTVYAAAKIDGRDIKKNSVTGKQVDESKLGQVPSAESADTAQSADTADTANTANTASSATTAGSAQPMAFASIAADGTVDASRSKGVTQANVAQSNIPGFYCVSGLSFPVKGVSITAETAATVGTYTPGSTAHCPNGGQVQISFISGGGGSAPFEIMLYG